MNAQQIIDRIDSGYDADPPEQAREYIGASIVGHECDALLAFSLRGFPNDKPGPRLKRIFRLGHMLEDEVVKDLKARADFRVWEVDPDTGKQHEYEAYGGHISCHMDGHISLDEGGEILVLEIKSMNEASFSKFKKHGVRYSHRHYFAQLQMMMGIAEINRALFIAINKNTSEYWSEIVTIDPFEVSALEERIGRALSGQAQKIATDAQDWRCAGCFKRSVCWSGAEAPARCQTCAHSTPTDDGGWHCVLHDHVCAAEPCAGYERYKPRPRKK